MITMILLRPYDLGKDCERTRKKQLRMTFAVSVLERVAKRPLFSCRRFLNYNECPHGPRGLPE